MNDQIQVRPKATPGSLTKAIENELRETRLKTVRAEAKRVIEEMEKAKTVLRGKEEELQNLFENNSDLFE